MFSRYIDNFDFKSRFRILKGGKISLVVSALLGSAIIASAAPTAGVVTSGTATISQNGNVTNINQSTSKASINWQGFSINSNETVNFNQPNVNSITLNRVVGNERSIIDGALNANGQVWILNSNGVLFNKNAKVNTAGLVATTKNISDADFQAGNYKFSGDSSASVVNMGTIEASDNGYVALLANKVSNDGTIKAYKGTVHLTGASEATINLNGNSIVSLTVNKGVLDALVENKNIIQADGGKIYLTTNAVDELLKGVVNNTGIIEANSVDDISGEIILFAHGGTANVGGKLDASAPNGGDGGFIETSGKTVNIQADSFVSTKSSTGKTGTWLIDPNDFVVAATNGNMTGTQLQTALASNNFIIETTTMGDDGGVGHGDIFINDAVSWSANKLTLKAQRHINVNAVMSMSGTASIDMGYGWNGTTYGNAVSGVASGINMGFNSTNTGYAGKINITAPSTNAVTINGNSYTIISDVAGLNNLAANTRYVVASDIDVSSIADWTGKSLTYTSFDLNGFGHVISGLRSTTNGLINSLVKGTGTVTASIENIGLDSLNVNSTNPSAASIGGLIGSAENVTIKNSFVSGSVRGSYDRVGGLVGLLYANTANGAGVDNSFTKGTVTGTNNGGEIGGLVAQTSGGLSLINYSFSESTVSGSSYEVGGLIGALGNANGSISNSYWKGVSVTGNTTVGGLVGGNNGNISNSYAAGRVTALTSGGNGLAGGTVSNSYFVTSLNSNAGSMGDQANAKADPAALVTAMGSSYELLSGNTLPTLKSKYATSSITATPLIAPTPTPTPTPEPVVAKPVIETNKDVDKVITSITNQQQVNVKLPTIVTDVKIANNIVTPSINSSSITNNSLSSNNSFATNMFKKLDVTSGESLSLVSTPVEGVVSEKITMNDLQSLKNSPASDSNNVKGSSEVRVSLGNGSIVELVNGGVTLPTGVEQEFYVQKTDSKNNNGAN